MSLLDEFRTSLRVLDAGGWNSLFQVLGLDVDSGTLRLDLLSEVDDIAAIKSLSGFEELCDEARQLIKPGKPAESILFHALASPAVRAGANGTLFDVFPTAQDLDLAENIVFGLQPPSLQDILSRFANRHIAICVFAREYRQKSGTVHANHADMVFSRTGISRVGTLPAHWDGERRAYSPLEPDDDLFAFRVLPCRYGVYLAVQEKGDDEDFGPYKMDRTFEASDKFRTSPQSTIPDRDHDFWTPVHKLFSGDECLNGLQLNVALEEKHINEKLRRIHLKNMGRPRTFHSGHSEPEINSFPFVLEGDLAEFLDPDIHGPGIVSPAPRPRIIEPATLNNAPLGTHVPRSTSLFASFNISADFIPGGFNRAHRAPEWMHVRTQIENDGSEKDLNEFENVEGVVNSGRVGSANPYQSRHYFDFSGDGWVSATVDGLGGQIHRRVPAYSIISAPDFYPYVSQSDVLDWSMNSVRSSIRASLWGRPPLTLCDQRVAPNLSLRDYGAPFVSEDKTVSAIVGLKGSADRRLPTSSSPKIDRTTYLPDGAAGFYAPGWDTSVDFDDQDETWFLAAHGLGSPFPEDAKLCAAISAFWPAVAPDTSRSSPWRVIAPMTDREIGLEDAPPWDGITGPRVIQIDGEDYIEDDDFAHVDYVKTALNGQFTMSETAKVDQATYQARILATHQAFAVMEAEFGSTDFRMLSFTHADPSDPTLQNVNNSVALLAHPVLAYTLVDTNGSLPLEQDSSDPSRWLTRDRISATIDVFVDGNGLVVWRLDGGAWRTSRSA